MVDKVNGTKIRQLRQLKGWSAEELSNQAGVSTPYIYKIENGEGNPSLTILYKIAGALGVPLTEIFSTGAVDSVFDLVVNANRVAATNEISVHKSKREYVNVPRTVKLAEFDDTGPEFKQIIEYLQTQLNEQGQRIYRSLATLADGDEVKIEIASGTLKITATEETRNAILILLGLSFSNGRNVTTTISAFDN